MKKTIYIMMFAVAGLMASCGNKTTDENLAEPQDTVIEEAPVVVPESEYDSLQIKEIQEETEDSTTVS